MTHIVPAIQEDCLLLIDAIMDTFPALLITQSKTIMNNFLEQISHTQCKKVDADFSDVGRVLTADPTQRLNTIKWRLKVIRRIKCFLQQLTQSPETVEGESRGYRFDAERCNYVFVSEGCGRLYTPE